MDRRVAGVALAIVTLASATPLARSPQSGPPSKAQSTTEQAASASERQSGTDLFMKVDTARARTGRRLLDDFFQDTAAVESVKPTLDIAIAALPDPLDSHLDYEFDAELGALRLAYEMSGFIIDRFWLPWPMDREKSELANRNNRIDTVAYRRVRPGVLLFRSADGKQLRLLYIVGEIPTSGAQTKALEFALKERDDLLVDPRITPTKGILRIIGPAFTGGAQALRRALTRWHAVAAHASDSIVVISGSATGVQPFEFAAARMSYQSTLHSDKVLMLVARNVLCRVLRIPIAQIVLLRESTTQYGAAANASTIPAALRDSTGKLREATCEDPFLDIPFPANISSLRSEYARAPSVAGTDAPFSSASTSRVPLNLQDPSRSMENPPVMSGLTPAMLDVLLDEIAQTLVAHKVRAVGILATDARDKLFLAEQLRQRRRDLTLFTTEANVLLLRRDVNASLRGMLVFGTYPLQLDAQRWDMFGVGQERLAFANDGSQGLFNAARLQLNDNAWLAEYGAPEMAGATYYCDTTGFTVSSRAKAAIPPVWVLTVGRTGFFPITACPTQNGNLLMPSGAIDSAARNEGMAGAPGASAWFRRAKPPMMSYPILCLALLSLMALFWRLDSRQFMELTVKVRKWEDVTCMRLLDWRLLLLHGHLYAILRALSIAVIGVGLGIALLHALGSDGMPTLLFSTTILCVALVTWLVARRAVAAWTAGRVVWRGLRNPQERQEERRDQIYRTIDFGGRLSMVAIATWFLVGCGVFVYQIHELLRISPMRGELFLTRAGELDGGFSPAMVLALSGGMFALWCSWHMDRIRALLAPPSTFESASLSDSGTTRLIPSEPDRARWAKHVRRVRTNLLIFIPDQFAAAMFVGCVLLAFALARAIAPSLEVLLFMRYTVLVPWLVKNAPASMFDYLARFSLTAAMSATAWALFRLARIWHDLQKILDDIGRSPRVTAFERLPRRVARLTRLNVLRMHADELVRSISMTQWMHMRRLYAAMSAMERAQLTTDLGPVRLRDGSPMWSGDYLSQLMNEKDARHAVWKPDDWMSARPPASSRNDEATAMRFLFDLTFHAHCDEPGKEDIDTIIERAHASEKSPDRPRSTSGNIRRTFSGCARLWIRSAEELMAVQAVDYIQWVLQHLRYLTLYIVASLVILTEFMWSYVLHPASTLWSIVILLALVAVLTLVTVVVQMNRNEVLSRIAGTTPGTVTWDLQFVLNLALIAVVPLVTFIGSELPWLQEGLVSWLSPVLKSLGRH